ncbi:uncharacterized protein LOC120606817 isoform X5 [Pteropus medius]|uniref:uncharacterized protein LOC120606817 isoform X5 n=1 Tax=Pteropus vampyrus TaxID=132908 RepID=UPI00196A3B5C|nr:uncharacterized protein LOC120606817 isoform X5 [Pteropus giganteus]
MGRERSLGCCAPAEPAWSRPRHRASVTLKLRVLVPLDLAAVAEPQEEDPLLWAWPGAQEAAQLPTPLGDAAKGHHGDPCLEAPGESNVVCHASGPSDVPGCDCGVHPGGVGAPGHRSEGAVLRGCQDSKPDVVSQLEQSGSPWMAWRGITRGLSPDQETGSRTEESIGSK